MTVAETKDGKLDLEALAKGDEVFVVSPGAWSNSSVWRRGTVVGANAPAFFVFMTGASETARFKRKTGQEIGGKRYLRATMPDNGRPAHGEREDVERRGRAAIKAQERARIAEAGRLAQETAIAGGIVDAHFAARSLHQNATAEFTYKELIEFAQFAVTAGRKRGQELP